MSTNLYQITCKTHLHAGSGDSNFGIIDRLVQRDPTDRLPCIYASSLKGAFREYWVECIDANQSKVIFGIEEDKGALIFNQAHLLSIPMRSNVLPYYNVTAPMAIENLLYKLDLINDPKIGECEKFSKMPIPSGSILVFNEYQGALKIEDYTPKYVINKMEDRNAGLQKIFGENYCLVSNADFMKICSDYSLPVLARNNLENGESKNLWYEQIIPREARFFFATTDTPLGNREIEKKKAVDAFKAHFDESKTIQIGANATIGYGQCQISKI